MRWPFRNRRTPQGVNVQPEAEKPAAAPAFRTLRNGSKHYRFAAAQIVVPPSGNEAIKGRWRTAVDKLVGHQETTDAELAAAARVYLEQNPGGPYAKRAAGFLQVVAEEAAALRSIHGAQAIQAAEDALTREDH